MGGSTTSTVSVFESVQPLSVVTVSLISTGAATLKSSFKSLFVLGFSSPCTSHLKFVKSAGVDRLWMVTLEPIATCPTSSKSAVGLG